MHNDTPLSNDFPRMPVADSEGEIKLEITHSHGFRFEALTALPYLISAPGLNHVYFLTVHFPRYDICSQLQRRRIATTFTHNNSKSKTGQ